MCLLWSNSLFTISYPSRVRLFICLKLSQAWWDCPAGVPLGFLICSAGSRACRASWGHPTCSLWHYCQVSGYLHVLPCSLPLLLLLLCLSPAHCRKLSWDSLRCCVCEEGGSNPPGFLLRPRGHCSHGRPKQAAQVHGPKGAGLVP